MAWVHLTLRLDEEEEYRSHAQKKVRWVKLQYLDNGAIPQCNILKHDKYNFYQGVCEVSTPYVKGDLSYEHERNDGSNGTWMDDKYVYV